MIAPPDVLLVSPYVHQRRPPSREELGYLLDDLKGWSGWRGHPMMTLLLVPNSLVSPTLTFHANGENKKS